MAAPRRQTVDELFDGDVAQRDAVRLGLLLGEQGGPRRPRDECLNQGGPFRCGHCVAAELCREDRLIVQRRSERR